LRMETVCSSGTLVAYLPVQIALQPRRRRESLKSHTSRPSFPLKSCSTFPTPHWTFAENMALLILRCFSFYTHRSEVSFSFESISAVDTSCCRCKRGRPIDIDYRLWGIRSTLRNNINHLTPLIYN
jgi:hypothetical protein